jgi:preprotein translocase subunit YajC
MDDILKKRGKLIPSKAPLSVEIKKSIYMLMSTLFLIILLVSIVYLLNSSQSTQKGYSLKQQQIKKDDLIDQSRELIGKIILVQSFKNIEANPFVQAMIKPENIVYIEKDQQE